MEFHLPYYVSPSTACFECKENFSTESCLQRHLSQHRDLHGHLSPGCTFDGWETKYCHQMAGLLTHLAQSLHLNSLSDLCQFLSTLSPEHHLQWFEMVPTEMERYNIEMFDKFLVERVSLNIYPLPPNCNATLIHWRPLYSLLCHLPDLHLKDFEQIADNLGQPLSHIPTTPKSLPAVADAHMHLDKLLKDTGHPAPVARLKAMSCCIMPNVKLEFL